MGHSVEWFSASFPGAPSVEDMDGIRIVRAGRQWTVHMRAFKRYRETLRDRFDAVIDEVNTMPFFTPMWARIPTVMLMFQLAREVWWYESPFPINAIGYAIEPIYLMGYRHTPVLTISRSTKQDLQRLGFEGPITIIPIGIERVVSAPGPKADTPTFIYVGRLAPSKRVGHMLEALGHFRRATGAGTLWLAGSGSERYQRSLTKLAQRLNVDDSVVFFGRVSALEKHRLMAEAHVLLMTSAREGWGLVVTEANAYGTPAIVYDVPGLRDSVRHLQTGLVVRPTPGSLAEGMLQLTGDPALYKSLREEALRWSQTFTYEAGVRVVHETIVRSVAT
jgi:glycosyltransferase involved in cell wall biosynthesis